MENMLSNQKNYSDDHPLILENMIKTELKQEYEETTETEMIHVDCLDRDDDDDICNFTEDEDPLQMDIKMENEIICEDKEILGIASEHDTNQADVAVSRIGINSSLNHNKVTKQYYNRKKCNKVTEKMYLYRVVSKFDKGKNMSKELQIQDSNTVCNKVSVNYCSNEDAFESVVKNERSNNSSGDIFIININDLELEKGKVEKGYLVPVSKKIKNTIHYYYETLPSNFNSHINNYKRSHEADTYSCDMCCSSFNKPQALKIHKYVHYRKKPKTCSTAKAVKMIHVDCLDRDDDDICNFTEDEDPLQMDIKMENEIICEDKEILGIASEHDTTQEDVAVSRIGINSSLNHNKVTKQYYNRKKCNKVSKKMYVYRDVSKFDKGKYMSKELQIQDSYTVDNKVSFNYCSNEDAFERVVKNDRSNNSSGDIFIINTFSAAVEMTYDSPGRSSTRI